MGTPDRSHVDAGVDKDVGATSSAAAELALRYSTHHRQSRSLASDTAARGIDDDSLDDPMSSASLALRYPATAAVSLPAKVEPAVDPVLAASYPTNNKP